VLAPRVSQSERERCERRRQRQVEYDEGYLERQIYGPGISTPLMTTSASSNWQLRGGKLGIYITVTDGNDGKCLYIPPGWKHAVYTLKPGYLGGSTFVPKGHPQHILQAAVGQVSALHKAANARELHEQSEVYDRVKTLSGVAVQEVDDLTSRAQKSGNKRIRIDKDIVIRARDLIQVLDGFETTKHSCSKEQIGLYS
jgi:hypothetical protein